MRIVDRCCARVSLILVVAMSACSPSPQRASSSGTTGPVDSAGVGRVREQLVKAVLAGDGRQLASVYADSAVVAAPGAPTLYGRAAIEAFIVPAFATTTYATYEIRPLAVTGHDGVLGEIGWQHEVATERGTPPQETWGRYAITWIRGASGEWKVAMDALVADSSNPVAGKGSGKP